LFSALSATLAVVWYLSSSLEGPGSAWVSCILNAAAGIPLSWSALPSESTEGKLFRWALSESVSAQVRFILRQNGPIAAVEADGRPLCHFLVRNLQHRIPTILRRSPDRFVPCSKRHNYQGCLSWSSLHPQLAWKPGGRSVILGFVCLRGVFDLDKAGEYDIIPVAIGLECANFCLGQFESARTDQEL